MAYPDLDVPVSRRRLTRDVAALLLILLGMGGLIVCAFVWHPLAGCALLSAFAAAVGAFLAVER